MCYAFVPSDTKPALSAEHQSFRWCSPEVATDWLARTVDRLCFFVLDAAFRPGADQDSTHLTTLATATAMSTRRPIVNSSIELRIDASLYKVEQAIHNESLTGQTKHARRQVHAKQSVELVCVGPSN